MLQPSMQRSSVVISTRGRALISVNVTSLAGRWSAAPTMRSRHSAGSIDGSRPIWPLTRGMRAAERGNSGERRERAKHAASQPLVELKDTTERPREPSVFSSRDQPLPRPKAGQDRRPSDNKTAPRHAEEPPFDVIRRRWQLRYRWLRQLRRAGGRWK